MKDLAPRFAVPLEVPRSRGARLLEAYSPKLERRVQFFDHRSFEQWLRLEADPRVIALCERPTRVGPKTNDRIVDFWVRRADTQELIVVQTTSSDTLPARVAGLPLHTVRLGDLAAASAWTNNWQRMLPVINVTRALIPSKLLGSRLDYVREPIALARVEHELAVGDPAIVRGAIFELLRTGRLLAPSLHVEALSLHTLLHPTA